ncbi:4535_t:CDS:2 [Ambispora gerdemannii]|uniref:4535_t:CDS:1 n=1 Tax=Ambispora gerdemannii TaxID=144530 RepID=A0A9N8VJ07_9GLOM|nr:4535_t:CDS:2 [Ambispora gerdemannii]
METIENYSFTESNNSVITEQESHLNVDFLLNKSYTLYHCTPLYNFNNEKIENYTNELKEYLLSKETVTGYDNDENEQDDEFNGSKIEEVKILRINLAGWSGVHDKPLGVKILFKYKGRKKEQESQIVILPSIQNEVSLTNSKFTKYPLLMVKALQTITEMFFEWLQSRFDCRVCPFIIQPYNLRQLVEIWSKSMFSDLDSIEDEVSGILEEIEDYLFRSLHLKLSSIVLTKVGLNSFYISNDGKLKFFHVPHDGHEQLLIKTLEQFIALAEM